MKTLFFILAFAFIGYSQGDATKFIEKYEKIGDHLVNSDPKAASIEAKKTIDFLRSTKIENYQELVKYLEPMANSARLDNQRTKYNDLSKVAWKSFGANAKNQKYYYMYCPMKKTYWMSSTNKIENPYYGSQMLTCGKVVETSK